MHQIPFNRPALLACMILRAVVGGLWYAPFGFGPAFRRLTGCSPAEMQARLPMAIVSDVVGSVIMTFILTYAVYYAGAASWATGLAVGLLNGFGFIAVTHVALVLYETRPFKLFPINNGHQAPAVMSAVSAE
jgi:hypothetical protein